MTHSKDQHKRAKADKLPLVTLAVDGRYVGRGGIAFEGPVSVEHAKLVEELIHCIIRERNNREGA